MYLTSAFIQGTSQHVFSLNYGSIESVLSQLLTVSVLNVCVCVCVMMFSPVSFIEPLNYQDMTTNRW